MFKLDRSRKAKMIEAFLQDALGREIRNLTILDIGCGNGMISQYFLEKNEVTGIDIKDQRREDMRDFKFIKVDTTQLPCEDSIFDIVISHHVIEHVADQQEHIREIHRVLKPDGLGYLGTPNKSSPIMEGHVGNKMVLHYRQMASLIQSQGFEPELISLRLASRPEKYHGEIQFGKFIPPFILKWMIPFFPSHYFLMRKKSQP